MTRHEPASGPRIDLEILDEPTLRMMAVGLLRELAGDGAADRYHSSPPPRKQLIKFIRDNDPDAR